MHKTSETLHNRNSHVLILCREEVHFYDHYSYFEYLVANKKTYVHIENHVFEILFFFFK